LQPVNTPTLSRWPLATTLVAALLLGACGGGRHQFCGSGHQLTYTDEVEFGYLRVGPLQLGPADTENREIPPILSPERTE
jgi:hypothetical protein